jgi:bifunctional enzyme CysN/CysC
MTPTPGGDHPSDGVATGGAPTGGADATGHADIVWHVGEVDRAARRGARVTGGVTAWLTGLSASGKSTIAAALERELVDDGIACYRLDGDNVRFGLNGDLGFSAVDRSENVRRVGEVARLMADAGLVVLVPIISPYAADRARVRAAHRAAGLRFVEAFVDTPLEVCEQRDPKGLYARARAGEITNMTGIDDPYDVPTDPDVVLSTTSTTTAGLVSALRSALGLSSAPPGLR